MATPLTRPAGRRFSAGRAGLAPYVFVAPAVGFFVFFLLVPTLYAIWLSTRHSTVTGSGLVPGSRRESASF